MSVYNPSIYIGETAAGLSLGAPLSSDMSGLLTSGIPSSKATDTNNATTTSGTDAVLTSMTLTPISGTYLVLFNTSATSNNAGAAISFSVYVGGIQDPSTLIKISPFDGGTLSVGSARGNAFCLTTATVNGSQAIAIEWSTSGGTATCGPRTLILLRIS